MPALDAIDRKILSLLQSDSRMTMQELSDKVGLSVSPCHRRVKLLEERGVITRYIATVDQKSLGSMSASSSRSSWRGRRKRTSTGLPKRFRNGTRCWSAI
jgi:DNA-binding Lrp family transcriptional regulator